MRTRYSTFFDYLTLALPGSMSTRSRFLALVPALEGLHVAKYGDGPMPRAEYKRRRKDVIRRLSDAQERRPGGHQLHQGLALGGTLNAAHNLALSYLMTGSFRQALAQDRQTLERRASVLGPTNPRTFNSGSAVARDLARGGPLRGSRQPDGSRLGPVPGNSR